MTNDIIALTVTAPTESILIEICTALVEMRLVASANLIPKIFSIYWWNGEIQRSHEALAILHTTPDCFSKIVDHVTSRHPYIVPQIVSHAARANASYAEWARETTRHAKFQ